MFAPFLWFVAFLFCLCSDMIISGLVFVSFHHVYRMALFKFDGRTPGPRCYKQANSGGNSLGMLFSFLLIKALYDQSRKGNWS